jgi:serine/threonine protein kinase
MTPPFSSPFSPLGPGDPREVAGYEIRARIGSGGMGSVYLSFTRGGQPIALKVVRAEFAEDPEFRRRFEAEVRAARQVQGLFTVPVLDSNTEGGAPWLATAFVPGLSLADVLRDHGPLPFETTLLLVGGVAEALQSIHAAGVIHRDLKPGNVLLAADGPKVIDFGIARAADATPLTGSDVRIGTPSYMAPEQVTGGSAAPATDVFALGLITHCAATGGHPFGEGAAHALMYRIVQDQPDLAATPEPLRELVAACLAKDPEYRPSPAQVIEHCRSLSPNHTLQRQEDWLPTPVAAEVTHRIQARPPAPAQPAPPPVHQAPATPPATPPPGFPAAPPVTPPATAPVTHQLGLAEGPPPPAERSKGSRRTLVLVAATAVVAAVLGGVIATQLGGDDKDPDPGARDGDTGQELDDTPPTQDADNGAAGGGDTSGAEPEQDLFDPDSPDDGEPGEGTGEPGRPADDPDSAYRLVDWQADLPIKAPVFTRDTTVSQGRCSGANQSIVELSEVRVSYRVRFSTNGPVGPTHFQYVYCEGTGLQYNGIEFNPEVFVGTVDDQDSTAEECYEAAHSPTVPALIPVEDLRENTTLKPDMGLCFELKDKSVVLLWVDRVTADPNNKDLPTYLTTVNKWEPR